MMPILKHILPVLFISLLFTACQRELNFEKVETAYSDTAVYTFVSSNVNCSNPVINGTYTAGAALIVANTITLKINVTTKGSYTVGTNTVNGVLFSTAGNFADTGIKVIILAGTGIPTSAGIYNFIPNINGCTFPVTFDTARDNGVNFLRCTIDGVARIFNVNLTGKNPVATNFLITGKEKNTASSPSLTLDLNNLTGTIDAGTYNLFSLLSSSPIYCFVNYFDGGVTWNQGTNNEHGKFDIIVTSKTTTRIKGTFSGTPYDSDPTGASKKIFTNGEFSAGY
jgi:hypothetical protein